MDDLDRNIFDYLNRNCRGADSAVKAQKLADLFYTKLRNVNQSVRNLRNSGILIGSLKTPPFGYFIPENADEVSSFMNAFSDELFAMLRTYQIMCRKVREMDLEGLQPELWPEIKTDAGLVLPAVKTELGTSPAQVLSKSDLLEE